jgi:cbb3-type cytochrome oxidase maturation protein
VRILLLLVPISLVLLGLAVWAFVWAVRRGQFDDLDTPALDILTDDDDAPRRPGTHTNPSPSSPTDGRTRDAG